MKEIRDLSGRGRVFLLGIFLLTLSCGGINQAPYGSRMTMPDSTTISSAVDVVFITKAVVVDKADNPLNAVDVDFTVCCDGAEFVDGNGGSLGSAITIRTDDSGVATANVLVYGNYAGSIIVSADIGTVTKQTTITKSIPAS